MSKQDDDLMWTAEAPYHVARVSKEIHYSIEFVESAVSYFELRGTNVFPFRKYPTLAEAKAAAQQLNNQEMVEVRK